MGVNITQQGVTTVMMDDNNITINGKTYKKPGNGNTISAIGGNVYVNGYKFKNGKFKRSIVAMWYNWL